MALQSRYKSAPQLQKVDDITYVITDASTMSDGEYTELTEDDRDMSELDDEKRSDVDNRSASGESVCNNFLTPDVNSYMSESDISPVLRRKKRQAPLPPNMSPTMAARHSYAFDLNALRPRTSTDTESSTDSKFVYQTSTDSETFIIPESARGSNFPGELAGVDNLHSLSPRRPHSADTSLIVSPRVVSKLNRLRDVFRSPQIGRRKTMKEKSITQKTQRVRKLKVDDGFRTKKSKVEDGSKLSKTRDIRDFEALPEMSSWIVTGGSEELIGDQEFEVTRIPDYEDFLSNLIEVTDPSQEDYEDISRCLCKLRSMMKEIDDANKQDSNEVLDGSRERPVSSNVSADTGNASKLASDNIASDNIASDNSASDNIASANNNSEEFEKQPIKGRELPLRRRSAPSAVLFRSATGSKSKVSASSRYTSSPGKKDHDFISQFKLAYGDSSRLFIAEGSVQFITGMQIQDRYLFLFSDLLLVTKQKSNTTFKLKHKVHLCDMWIASCLEEVSETTVATDRSFVLGWPITNVVATFPSPELKDDWLSHLKTHITMEKEKDTGKSLQLHVSLKDVESTTSRHYQMTINNLTQVKDVVLDCLKQINISESEAKDYQLWALTVKEGSPYPLIGHETPFSIKRSQTRELQRSKSGNDLDDITSEELDTVVENRPAGQKCEFYLQQKKPPRKNRFEDSSLQKPMKKNKRSQHFFNIFRKSKANQHLVFERPLADICDENLDPPEAITKLMILVYQQGPHTPGILRKSNNIALARDIREKIDSGEKYTLEDNMALTAASVFKEFLRHLPGGLLMCSFHEQWLTVTKDDPYQDKINKITKILAKLPQVNYHMIKLTVCLLQHLAKYCSENHMGPSNLATCIAPSLYIHGVTESPHGKLKVDVQKQMEDSMCEMRNIIVPLVAFMITNHIELFGEEILSMFVKYGCQASPVQIPVEERYDSQMQPSAEEDDEEEDMVGEEEDNFNGQYSQKQLKLKLEKTHQHGLRESNSGTDSDSMHSVLSMQDVPMGLQRDDSSIDSLGEREYYTHESPKAMKAHLSPSNLSRDSGLTLSDNQLYDEDAAYHADMRDPRFTDHNTMDIDNHSICSNKADYHVDNTVSPVAPPRKLSIRRKISNETGSEGRRHGIVDFTSQRAPLKHSASTTQLDDNQILNEHKNYRALLSHSSLDKRVSADSIGEEMEVPDIQSRPMDFLGMSKRTDIGTLTKSESGAHLFLNNGTLPAEISLRASENTTDHHFLRQSSVIGSSVPMSPESRHSQSSCDSVISDSTFSVSHEGSVNSAPLTPDEPQDILLNWVPDINLPVKPWQGMFTSGLNTQKPYTSSKPIPDIISRNEESCDNTVTSENSLNLNRPEMWSGKPNQPEDVEITGRHQVSLKCRPSDIDFSMEAQPHPLQAFHTRNIPSGKHRPRHVGAGSPPPNVILQTLSSTFKSDYVPLRADRRSSVDSFEPRLHDSSLDMQSIGHEDYIHAASRPIIISPESSSSNSTATSRAKLSKYISPRQDLPLSSKDSSFVLSKSRHLPNTPINHQQVIKRNVIMKCDIPDDVTETQRENSARARKMYELSLMQYNEQIHQNPSDIQSVTDRANPIVSVKSKSAIDDTATNSLAPKEKSDCSFQQEFGSDDSGASGFLDMGSISHSLHEDIVSRRRPTLHPESNATSLKRSISPESLVSHSRNSSKLSDSGSSSGSSVSISTLGKHSDSFGRCSDFSDSFGRCSDLSNTSSVTVSSVTSRDSTVSSLTSRDSTVSSVTSSDSTVSSVTSSDNTVSSVTSSDSNPEVNLVVPRLKNVTRFDQKNVTRFDHHSSPIENIRGGNIKMYEIEDISHQKDPEEVYQQSKKMYEQNASSEISSFALTPNKPSQMLPSFPQHPQQKSSNNILEPLHQTEVTKQAPPQTRRTESRARLNLEITNVSLHRSRSDSSERVHKLGAYSSRLTTKTDRDDFENNCKVKDTKLSSEDVKVMSLPRDIKSELHEKFLKARSCFHQSEITDSPSPARSPHSTARFIHRSPSALGTRSSNCPHPALSATVAASTTAVHRSPSALDIRSSNCPQPALSATVAALPSVLKSNMNLSEGSSSQENKKEIHWSVKDLKSKYDKDNSESIYKSTSHISQSHPHSPPPYQNQPSFRHPDSPMHSISSSSSSGSDRVSGTNKVSQKTTGSQRQGPQNYIHTSPQYSSSEDSCGSSPDNRLATWLSSSSLDEELSDYTNTTYI